MPDICTVPSCSNRSNRERDRRYFRIPKVVEHKGKRYQDVTRRRRSKWLANLAVPTLSAHARVCSDHFVKGCPSKVFEENDVDWAPTVKLGKKKAKPTKPTPKPESKPASKNTETQHKTQAKKAKSSQKGENNTGNAPHPGKALPKRQKESKQKRKPTKEPERNSDLSRKRKASDGKVSEPEVKPKQFRRQDSSDSFPRADEGADRFPTNGDTHPVDPVGCSAVIKQEDVWPHHREREAEVLLDFNNIIRIELSKQESDTFEQPDFTEQGKRTSTTKLHDAQCQTELTCRELENMENELETLKSRLHELQVQMNSRS